MNPNLLKLILIIVFGLIIGIGGEYIILKKKKEKKLREQQMLNQQANQQLNNEGYGGGDINNSYEMTDDNNVDSVDNQKIDDSSNPLNNI